MMDSLDRYMVRRELGCGGTVCRAMSVHLLYGIAHSRTHPGGSD